MSHGFTLEKANMAEIKVKVHIGIRYTDPHCIAKFI